MSATSALLSHPGLGPELASWTGDGRARGDRTLFARLQAGDPRARAALAERFMPLARSLARRYESSGEPLEDLVQVASLALVKAIDRFDSSRGLAFTSFAVPTIVGELKRHFRDRTWAVRPPRELQELVLRIDRAAVRISQELDRAPTIGELAAATGANEEQILEALQARGGRRTLSLHAKQPGEADAPTLEDSLGSDDDGFEHAESRALLDRLCVGLPARSRDVLRMRFEEDLTQAEIGQRLGVSQMQVSRIIRQTLAQLREVAELQESLAGVG
ncbi:MAG: SigB/SigF/SigG family RNA polymerase sigma factor [Solirubrobacterales bacterium]|nr:SigB/SigF/SigG family RNA polymerase sigma factor [Solirubrobacterales bacterium]